MRSNGDITDRQSGVFKGYQQALTEESARYEKICLPEQIDELRKLTSMPVPQNVLGNNKPHWMALNTDLTDKGQASTKVARRKRCSISTTAITELIMMKNIRLNPKAHCYVPQHYMNHPEEEMTMITEVDKEHTGKKKKRKKKIFMDVHKGQ